MDFLKKIFPRAYFAMAPNGNTNITIARETSVDQCLSQSSNNSNKLEAESNDAVNTNEHDTTNNDSSVVIINEFGITKTLHNLENVTPMEIENDNTNCKELENSETNYNNGSEHSFIFTDTAEARLVHVTDDKQINKIDNDVKEIKIPREAVLNEVASLNNLVDDETRQNLKEFEEAFNNLDESALTDDVATEFINLDEFIEICDELDRVNEDPMANNGSENSIYDTTKSKEILDSMNKRLPDINDNVDIISISSTEDETIPTGVIENTITKNAVSDPSDSDDGDGYNSSDFEFITEPEANLTGFIINFGLENCQNLSPASSEPLINYYEYNCNGDVENEPSDPGEGLSRQHRPRNEFEDRSYRNNHNIPEGDDYLGLFQGIYNPLLPMSEIYFLENKSVRASAMNSQYDGIGFDKQLAMRRHQPDSSEDEFEDEAKESAKKILKMYPGQNRKRRRRHF